MDLKEVPDFALAPDTNLSLYRGYLSVHASAPSSRSGAVGRNFALIHRIAEKVGPLENSFLG